MFHRASVLAARESGSASARSRVGFVQPQRFSDLSKSVNDLHQRSGLSMIFAISARSPGSVGRGTERAQARWSESVGE